MPVAEVGEVAAGGGAVRIAVEPCADDVGSQGVADGRGFGVVAVEQARRVLPQADAEGAAAAAGRGVGPGRGDDGADEGACSQLEETTSGDPLSHRHPPAGGCALYPSGVSRDRRSRIVAKYSTGFT
jgi:hypothetical protein